MRSLTLATCLSVVLLAAFGCTTTGTTQPQECLLVSDITSFAPATACAQAREVIASNPYDRQLLENVYAQLVAQVSTTKQVDNATLIRDEFVIPVQNMDHMPRDVVSRYWNYYFVKEFVSLTDYDLRNLRCGSMDFSAIRKELQKEFELKKLGFAAMGHELPPGFGAKGNKYYDALWARCN